MSVSVIDGDLFSSDAPALAHGVNCRGLMGKGIAVEFRSRWPEMYSEYRALCEQRLLVAGDIYPYRDDHDVTIFNVATQTYPGPDASLVAMRRGMEQVMEHCVIEKIPLVALPWIGCGIGGLELDDVRDLLDKIADLYPEVQIEVWQK